MNNYKFTVNPYNQEGVNDMYGVDYNSLSDKEKSLIEISWHEWTPQKIQMIIDKTKVLVGNEEYDYQVAGSDFLISIDKDEVHFFDWRTEQEEADFIWSTEKFITFMKAFKEFVAEAK